VKPRAAFQLRAPTALPTGLRHHVRMPDREPGQGGDVLSSLPATRPHRRSARRASGTGPEPARGQTGEEGKAPPRPRPTGSKPGSKAKRAATRPTAKPTPAAAGKRPAAKPRSGKGTSAKPPKPRAARPRSTAGALDPSGTPTAVRPSAATRRAREPGSPVPSASAQETRALESRPLEGLELVNTTVQAAGELAQIGLSLTARAVRGAISRLPRP
jgi:hypothetical protein